jgi:predicted ribosome quality control (RQC) complex YloA/Tae2 family protein
MLERDIAEAFSQEKNQLVLRLSDLPEALLFSCDRSLNTLYLHPHFVRARSNSVDVLGRCVGQTVTDVRMHPVDRVIMLKLVSGDHIVATFFGVKSNVIIVDTSDMILDAFKNRKGIIGTKMEYRKGEIIYDIDELRTRLAETPLTTIAAVMKETFPTLGAMAVKEVLHRAEVKPFEEAASITNSHVQLVQQALSSVLGDMKFPKPRIYAHSAGEEQVRPAVFSIIPLSCLSGLKEQLFDDVHEAIRFYISRLRSYESVEEDKQALIRKLNQKLIRTQRTIEVVENDLKNNSRAEAYQRFGSLLMGNLQQIRQGAQLFVTHDENEKIEIPLSKELSPVHNAQQYFEKAKRSRVARKQSLERLANLRSSIAPAEKLLKIIEKITSRQEMKHFMSEYKAELEEFGIDKKSEERIHLPFRIFVVDGGWEVWAGKSSKSNDQLTLKNAKPNDLWFHARGAAGSHVVLKVSKGKGEPGKKAKEQAASIAAYYSKMKNAKMVPVVMTERKYVRKPKGAAPGSVTIEREKVIFAEPVLPADKHYH